MSGRKWAHDELQHDLAETRRQVGEIAAERLGIGSFATGGQMDVFAVKPSWTTPNPTVWEIKVSRSDFMADTQAGKYRRYLPFCRRLYFAAPKGLLTKADIPEGMGLCVRGENGWSTVVAPRVRSITDEDYATIVFSLLLKTAGGPWARPTREERVRQMARAKEVNEWTRDLPSRIREALTTARRQTDEAAYARRQLVEALGEPDDGSRDLYSLAHAVLSRAPVKAPSVEPVRRNLRNLILIAERADEALAVLGNGHPARTPPASNPTPDGHPEEA